MKIFRIVLHGFVLVIIDIAGVACGAYLVYWLLRIPNLIALQLPLAVMLSLAFFYIWFRALRALKLSRFVLGDNKERTACLIISLIIGILLKPAANRGNCQRPPTTQNRTIEVKKC